MEWSKVVHKHKRVIIMAGGGRLPDNMTAYLDNPNNVFIGVNNAAKHLPVNYMHTQDTGGYDKANPEITGCSGIHYVAVPDQDGDRLNNCRPKNPRPYTRYLKRVHCGGISKDPTTLYSGWNSSYSAYGLAVLMEPEEIFMFGVILGKDVSTYWHDNNGCTSGPNDRSYAQGLETFNQLDQSVLPKTYNCSVESHITAFEKIDVEDFDRMLLS